MRPGGEESGDDLHEKLGQLIKECLQSGQGQANESSLLMCLKLLEDHNSGARSAHSQDDEEFLADNLDFS